MARAIYQYKPINDTPDTAIGIQLPLNKGAQGMGVGRNYSSGSQAGKGVFDSTYTTRDAVITNLKNLILTEKGERYMQPEFGTNIRTILFENNTEEIRTLLRTAVNEDIERWLPYVNLDGLDVTPSEDMHSINIQMRFQITSVGANVVINILASENEFVVTEVEQEMSLTEVGSFSSNTAFSLGSGGTY